jgi:hypothetical protein
MSTLGDGGSVFPGYSHLDPGISLRDFIAIAAMQAYLLREDDYAELAIAELAIEDSAVLAKCAYAIADGMLAERMRNEP